MEDLVWTFHQTRNKIGRPRQVTIVAKTKNLLKTNDHYVLSENEIFPDKESVDKAYGDALIRRYEKLMREAAACINELVLYKTGVELPHED